MLRANGTSPSRPGKGSASAPCRTTSHASSATPASARTPASGVPVHSAWPSAPTSHCRPRTPGENSVRRCPAHSSVTCSVCSGRRRRFARSSSSGRRTAPSTRRRNASASSSGAGPWLRTKCEEAGVVPRARSPMGVGMPTWCSVECVGRGRAAMSHMVRPTEWLDPPSGQPHPRRSGELDERLPTDHLLALGHQHRRAPWRRRAPSRGAPSSWPRAPPADRRPPRRRPPRPARRRPGPASPR